MEVETEKVYVAVGNDLQDGLATLEWALRKWNDYSISIVILHATNFISKDYVYTYYGKVPASYVNDEQLEFLRREEQEKTEKILNQYIAFCGQVKAKIFKIVKYEKPIHMQIIELLSGLRITKLVMGITFMKSSTCKSICNKSRSPISGLRYVQREKPDFCELYLVSEGKLVFLKEENNEGVIEDDLGVPLAKINSKRSKSIKTWLGKKMFPEYGNGSSGKSPLPSPSSSTSNDSPSQWEKCVGDVELYFGQLMNLSVEEEEADEVADDMLNNSPIEPQMPENLSPAERTEELKIRIGKAREEIQLRRREAKENIEQYAKAEWAISLCTSRVGDLKARITEERAKRGELEKDLDTMRDELQEIRGDVEQKKSKLSSILELQHELSNKLKSSSSAKLRAEVQLERVVGKRAGMIQEIEKFRRQRDVMQRRIEFCREKDAIGMAMTGLNDLNFSFKEFTAEEIRMGTDDFSERLRLKSAGDLTNVFRGQINRSTVAIKLYNDSAMNGLSAEAFHAKVKLLSRIKQPHIVSVLGFCSKLKCIVFEYMHNGCLRDALFSHRSSTRRNHALNWHARIRVIAEICSGLGFLHLTKPRPIYHGSLNPSKILLDRNNVAKIYGFRLDCSPNDSDMKSDIRAFGNLVLQILTGRNWAGLVEEALEMDHASDLVEVLDQRAGQWPLELAMALVRIAIECSSLHDELNTKRMGMGTVMRRIEEVRKKADDFLSDGECNVPAEGGIDMEDSGIPPSFFFCPVYQEVMRDPHVAEDGFSYELDAIERWLRTGNCTSPMTNLQLKHTNLTPNHTLRTLIHDWHTKRSIPLPQS